LIAALCHHRQLPAGMGMSSNKECLQVSECRSGVSIERSARKLLILDINGLLVHRIFNADPTKLPCEPDAVAGEFTLFLRPHVRDFIKWCSDRFVIVIWSTVQQRNIMPLVELVFGDLPPPVAILDQSHCTDTGLQSCCWEKMVLVNLSVKLLQTVWEHPAVQALGPFGAEDTLLLDDSPYKAAWNPEHTASHPREWTPETRQSGLSEALGAEGDVRRLLELFSDGRDGRSVVKVWNSTCSADGWVQLLEDHSWCMVRGERSSKAGGA